MLCVASCARRYAAVASAVTIIAATPRMASLCAASTTNTAAQSQPTSPPTFGMWIGGPGSEGERRGGVSGGAWPIYSDLGCPGSIDTGELARTQGRNAEYERRRQTDPVLVVMHACVYGLYCCCDALLCYAMLCRDCVSLYLTSSLQVFNMHHNNLLNHTVKVGPGNFPHLLTAV